MVRIAQNDKSWSVCYGNTMANLPAVIHKPLSDIDKKLRDKMGEIEAIIQAIANEQTDIDILLAEILENESEQMRISIVEKLREMLKARADEKEKELDKFLEQQKRVEVTRQRNAFRQWLTWIMSEETLRKIREAFMASPMLEQLVRGIGHNLANKGVQNQMTITSQQELGGLSSSVGQGQGANRGKEGDKGRQ